MYEKILLSVLTAFVAVVLAACGGNSDSKTLNSLD
ncbi:ABC transporter substrate-binding protein, partial [Campylobacter jejuni]|nr:ABC transporter substrate-binding protein [Campylobacter jejuni]